MIRLIFLLLFFSMSAMAQFSGPQMQQFVIKNLLNNGGFEGGLANWFYDATGAITTTAANVSSGNAAMSWDSASAGTIVNPNPVITVPAGLYGHNGVASCNIKCSSGTCTHKLKVFDGSGEIASQSITSSLTYARTTVNFVFPSSGTVYPQISATASDEPLIYIDDCYVSEATNISNVSQASIVGSAYYPPTASCSVTRTNTSLGSFGTTANCTGPTIESNIGPGTILTTDANTPTVLTVNNLPSGQYLVQVTFYVGINTSTQTAQFQITDGTTPSVATAIDILTTANPMVTTFGYFNYSNSGNRTFELYSASTANTLTLSADANNRAVRWIVYRWPSEVQISYTPEKLANSWSGFHSNDCSWSRTNTSLGDPTADASCTFTESVNNNFGSVTSYLSGSDKLPGIVFTPSRAGTYMACANFGFTGGSTGASIGVEMSDTVPTVIAYQNHSVLVASNAQGETLCGLYRATTTSSKTIRLRTQSSTSTAVISQNSSNGHAVDWTIIQVDQSFPMPLIANAVVTNNSGVTKELYAVLNCDAGSSITSQSGTTAEGVATIGNISSGVCTGTFAGMWSGTPVCNADAKGSTLDSNARIDATSSTAFSLYCITPSTGAAAASCDVGVFCTGPK